MMKLKENASLLIVKMKKISFLLILIFLASCTSNTILKKPDNLIPKDSMSLVLQQMMIASSAKYVKNKNLEKNIEYMPLVYDQFKIDSARFQTSNLYYMSTIDLYKDIVSDAKTSLEKQKEIYEKINHKNDSLRNDSLNKIREQNNINFKKIDSLKKLDLNLKPNQ